MKKLEACMIIKNEEQMLPKALDSLKGIDHITIVDTGSSDKTFDIYKEYQDKGFSLDWHEYSEFNKEPYSLKSFSHARNECKRKCLKGDWLFILDGDEWFDFDIAKIKSMINSQWVKDYDVLTISVKTEIESTTQPRVFRNKPEIWYFQEFHNSLTWWKDGPEGSAERFPSNKFYKTSLEIIAEYGPNHNREPDRTLRIVEGVLAKNPLDTRALYYCSREWLVRKEPLKALYYLTLYAEIAAPNQQMAETCFLLSTIYADLRRWKLASEWALKSVGLLPSYKQAWQMVKSLSHRDFQKYFDPMIQQADNMGVMVVRQTPKEKPESKIIQLNPKK